MKSLLDKNAAGAPALASHQAADEHLRAVNDAVRESNGWVRDLKGALETAVVGQDSLLKKLPVGLLANANILVEGARGLTKPLALRPLARSCTTPMRGPRSPRVGVASGRFSSRRRARRRQRRAPVVPAHPLPEPTGRLAPKCVGHDHDGRTSGTVKNHGVSTGSPISAG